MIILFPDQIIGSLMKQDFARTMQTFLSEAMSNCGQNPKIVTPLAVSNPRVLPGLCIVSEV